MSGEGSADRLDADPHRSALHATFDALASREPVLWGLAVGALLLDVGLTVIGLELGLEEQNLLAIRLLEATGLLGLGLVKTAALAVAVGLRSLLPPRFVFIAPLGLAIPWLVASVVNLVVIALALDALG